MTRKTKNLTIIFCIFLLAVLGWKLWTSEQLRIAWNRPVYFYDGRHNLSGADKSVNFNLKGELWVRDKSSGKFIRIIPNAGIEFCDEQNLSFSSARHGERKMLKLRAQWSERAKNDYKDSEWSYKTNKYLLYFEQRNYSNDNLISYYKDFAYGNGGVFFVNPITGEHIARKNFSTIYVPEPTEESFAGPSNWLWAAAVNKKFVEEYVSGKRVAPPRSRKSPGKKGEYAIDENYMYFYGDSSSGWIRIKIDNSW